MSYNLEIEVTEHFEHLAKRLKKKYKSLKTDLSTFLEELNKNPELGIDMGNGLRKIRLAIKSKGKGKRGGARIITYTDVIIQTELKKIYLISIYDKSEISNISKNDLIELLKEILD